MVNLDLSKVLPEDPHNYLAPFLPGGFFVVSILIANPKLVSQLAANSQQSLEIGHYVMLGIALFLAFAIGNGFVLLVGLIDFLLSGLYRLVRFFWKELCRGPLQRFSVWLITKLKKQGWRQMWAIKFNRHMQTVVCGSEEMKNIVSCWHIFGRRLLETHYGIDLTDVRQGEWDVLYWTLQSPTAKERRAGRSVMIIASHATGWSGLVAMRIAPALHNRYYFAFCILMILSGLLHQYYVDVALNDPLYKGYVTVRAVLREFWKTTKKGTHPPLNSGPESGEGTTQ
jgi:hypothetical protein